MRRIVVILVTIMDMFQYFNMKKYLKDAGMPEVYRNKILDACGVDLDIHLMSFDIIPSVLDYKVRYDMRKELSLLHSYETLNKRLI